MSVTEILPTLQSILARYVLLLCFTLGFGGSILNILVFIQKSLRSNACSVYMLAINVMNTIEIPYALVRVTVNAFLPRELRFNSDFFCKFVLYFQNYLLNVVRSFTVLACIDRYALCSSNARIRKFSSVSLARKLVIIVTCIWLMIPLHMIFFYGRISTGQCGVSGVYGIFFSSYSAFLTSGHLILMIVFSSLAIYNVQKAQLRILPVTQHGYRNHEMRKKDIQLIKMLVGEVIAYVLTSAMFPIFTIYSVASAGVSKSSERIAIENFFAFLVPDFLVMINPCTTFYIYLCTSKTFRTLCKETILCRWNQSEQQNTIQMKNQRERTRDQPQTNTIFSRKITHQLSQDDQLICNSHIPIECSS